MKILSITHEIISKASHVVAVPDWFDSTNPDHRALFDEVGLHEYDYNYEAVETTAITGSVELTEETDDTIYLIEELNEIHGT